MLSLIFTILCVCGIVGLGTMVILLVTVYKKDRGSDDETYI